MIVFILLTISAIATMITAPYFVDYLGRIPSLKSSRLATAWNYDRTESRYFVGFLAMFASMAMLFGLVWGWPGIISGVLCLLPVSAAVCQYRDAHGLTRWNSHTWLDHAVAAYEYDPGEAVQIATMFVCISIAVVVGGMLILPWAVIPTLFYALPISGAFDLHKAVQANSAMISA